MSANSSRIFTSIGEPQKEQRWGSFVASYLVQGIVVVLVLVYSIVSPHFDSVAVNHVNIAAPELETPQAPKTKPLRREANIKPVPVVTAPVVPKIEAPVLQVQQPQRVHKVQEVAEVAQPQIAVPVPKFDSKILTTPPGPKANRIIATNTFGGSSATPTLQKVAPSKVQTGGFGDPNGVPANARGNGKPNIALTGSFDLPAGAGNGNGTGGASGARGTIASAGFGNGVAVQGGGGRGGSAGQGRIQSTSFVNPASGSEETHRAKPVTPQGITSPVSIQSKPSPVYTSEARQLRIEGEVLLNVVFAANGQIRILNVVRGLGHGLDEAAQRAAKGMKFSPAMRDGHPVDSNATLHIVFQLS